MSIKRPMKGCNVSPIDLFVDCWNNRFSNFQITFDDIHKPKSMFIMKMILTLFDNLGFDTDSIVESSLEECEQSECSESLNELLPILNVTEAINTTLECISSQISKVTPLNLLQPSTSVTLNFLRFILNYVVFVDSREEERLEAIKQVETEVNEQNHLREEVDRLMDEMNRHKGENVEREQRIKQLEERVERLKIEPTELSEIIEKLSNEMAVAREQGKLQLDELTIVEKRQNELHDEISRLRSCIVTKEEQAEVLKNRECAEQKDEEVSKCKQEVNENLWEQESSIRTLNDDMLFIKKVLAELQSLDMLYSKIQDAERSNSGWCEGENDLIEVRGNCEELQRKIDEIKAADRAWEEDNHKAETEVCRELEIALKDDKTSEMEYEECLRQTSEQREMVEKLKMSTVQYNREREHLINKYTKEIPQEYDADIENKIERIKNIISGTLGQKLSKK